MGENLCDLWLGKDFLDKISQRLSIKELTNSTSEKFYRFVCNFGYHIHRHF